MSETMTPQRQALVNRIVRRTTDLGLTPRQVALQATGRVDLIRDLKRTKGLPSGDRMQRLASVLGVSVEWLLHGDDNAGQVRSEVRGTGLSPAAARDAFMPLADAKPVPLLGSAYGGDWEDMDGVDMIELHLSEVLDHLGRPQSLQNDPEGYAVEIVGESMAPRFEPGERAFVSPRSPVHPGNDVVVQLRGTGQEDEADRVTMVLIKRLVKRSSKFVELRQFTPDRTFRVPVERVAAIHRVRGRL